MEQLSIYQVLFHTQKGIAYLHPGVIGSYAMLTLLTTKPETGK
jgi:hypothetical protein